ncbi:type II toxin-antitoxin system HicB family antitoxin [Halorientalis marina]|jgi:predicted RNase H-like HicB family nuclease|uniref:type II toxin-antitoxin system HicB family antitoxin n=1 Tax=Halorientalis marina TaxID=2931976 RepID=UPI001FF33C0D|nr:type II toxin-antitoxin system HicB family antitoxin [Halorientalis marina]
MSSREIRLIEETDGEWSAVDVDTGVVSRAETRREALEVLDEAVAYHTDGTGSSIDDEVAYLEDHGIDPAQVTDPRDLPDVMQ